MKGDYNMNTIKFEPANKPKTETHDVESYRIKRMNFAGKEYKVYSNVGLTIYVTNQCNADCDFCMNKYEDNFLCSKEIRNNEEYLRRLEYILRYLSPLKPSVMITGGEPTKSKRLPDVIRLVHKYGYKLRSFSTNGSGLLDVIDGKSILQSMYENDFLNNINISRHSVSREKNYAIMKNKEDLTNHQLSQIAGFCDKHNMTVRMGCTLQKGSVNNLEKVLEYQWYYESLGIATAIFREPVPIEANKKGFKEYQRNFVDISKIVQCIEHSPEFMYLYTLDGLYYKVRHFQYKDKLVKCYKEKNTASTDIVRDLIFYADGRLVDTNWNDLSKVLLPYEGR